MVQLLSACRSEGLLIFNNFNRVHIVPPCTITEAEARDGIARLDRALSTIASYYVGAS